MQWNRDIEAEYLNRIAAEPDKHICIDGSNFTARGRALISVDGLVTAVHRRLYNLAIGTPKYHYLIRDCGLPTCINPHHFIESESPRLPSENPKRGRLTGRPTRGEINAAKTECPHGHPYTRENTYVYYRNGRASRHCRTCRLNQKAARKRNNAR